MLQALFKDPWYPKLPQLLASSGPRVLAAEQPTGPVPPPALPRARGGLGTSISAGSSIRSSAQSIHMHVCMFVCMYVCTQVYTLPISYVYVNTYSIFIDICVCIYVLPKLLYIMYTPCFPHRWRWCWALSPTRNAFGRSRPSTAPSSLKPDPLAPFPSSKHPESKHPESVLESWWPVAIGYFP